MTKKKAPSLLDNKDTPEIPHNAGCRLQVREGGLIMGWMNNRQGGAPLKFTPTNKKIKGKGKAPTKSAAASNYATNKPPTTNPPPRTSGRMYTNWKQEPAKYALARAVEKKLKVLDPQLAAGEIMITYGTLRDHVKYAKEKAKKRGVS